MSINWVMLPSAGPEPFVKLPNETILNTSPARTSFSLKTHSTYPGNNPFSIYSSTGVAYLTNQRLVYLPDPKADFKSFSAPILNIQDTGVRSPLFGANYWFASVKPVPGGNIPTNYPFLELKMIFSDGGAFDHSSRFEQIKERVAHALQNARDASGGAVNLADVNLEQLPAYEPAGASVPIVAQNRSADLISSRPAPNPSEPPPGYEEALAQAVVVGLDARLRTEAEHSSENQD